MDSTTPLTQVGSIAESTGNHVNKRLKKKQMCSTSTGLVTSNLSEELYPTSNLGDG